MKSHWDVFINDPRKWMNSEVTQFAKLFSIMKTRVMTKKMQKALSGTDGKVEDQVPWWYAQCDKHRKKKNCNLTYVTLGTEVTLTVRILLLSSTRKCYMIFSLIFLYSQNPNILFSKKERIKWRTLLATICTSATWPQFEHCLKVCSTFSAVQ